MDHGSKKSVRFSSPFEIELKKPASRPNHHSKETDSLNHKSSFNSSALKTSIKDVNISGSDSWNAFDAKMSKSKTTTPIRVENQFLELSFSQKKSLKENEDFSILSFQDAKGLIDRDENERLKFMNDDVSFSEELEDVEAPSLLSFTSYFQQGSSFPVPYVGNDSTMMLSENLAGISLTEANSAHAQRRNSQRLRQSSSRRTSSTSISDFIPSDTSRLTSAKPDLSRNDSLAKFFLGPQSNGMNKFDIMEYVLDYCNRRASIRLSDASERTRLQNNSVHSHSTPDKHDSGCFGMEEKTGTDGLGKKSQPTAQEKTINHDARSKGEKAYDQDAINHPPPRSNLQDQSMMLADAESVKSREGAFLDVSDVGSIEGFEKFKKNLSTKHRNDDRYKAKAKHHLEFEKKRLNVDERYSHPRLSPKAFKGPGSTASLERPKNKILCNSPPEKLTRSKSEHIIDKSPDPNVSTRNVDSGGQCHSTPLTCESYVSKLIKTASMGKDKEIRSKSSGDKDKMKEDHQKRQKAVYSTDSFISSANSNGKITDQVNTISTEKIDSPVFTSFRASTEVTSKSGNNLSFVSKHLESHSIRPTTLSTDSATIFKPANILPDGLSIMPVIHSGSQSHQHSNGLQQCTCPHQCGQQPSPMFSNVGGMPIVIHIHLPYSVPTTGTVVHPVPTPSTEKPRE